MLSLVVGGLRTRWASLLGGFLALALGAGMLTATGLGLAAALDPPPHAPERFASSPVVVLGQDRLTVEVRRGPGTASASRPLDRPQPVDTGVLRELRARWTLTGAGTGAPDAVGLDAPVAEVRAVVGDRAQVLTGADRRRADPGHEDDTRELTGLNALLGTAGGVAAFVSVFVVASVFAFSVALRRREFGLLRTAGATPAQVRRLLLAEAAVLGVTASAAGCALGALAAPPMARALVARELAPAWFATAAGGSAGWPYHVAFWTGLGVALAGAAAAAHRAGRTGPTAVLREADVDRDVLPPGRALLGAGLLAAGLGLLSWTYGTEPEALLKRKTYTTLPMLLIGGTALLAPLLVRPVARLLPVPGGGAVGLLVRANAAAAVRRTSAVAAPVLVTVALAGTLFGASESVARAKETEARERTAAPYAAEAGPTSLFVRDGAEAVVKYRARAVADPAAFAELARLPVVAGDLRDLDDRSIVVNEEFERRRVGEEVEVWRADGSGPVRLRVAAVLARGTGDNGPYVTRAQAPGTAPDRLTPGTEPRPVNRAARTGLRLLLGLTLLYTVIALASTLLMATSVRGGELAALRLAGATRAQALRAVTGEALLAVAVGTVLGLAVTAAVLGALGAALAALSAPVTPALPWAETGAAAAVCAAVAVAASALPAWRLSR
ncbi:FtsX-like permease family protein [Streptomyces roseolus]|uniref:FtsX-like permease family protein n=1 Tax=Streptomyces roseolus TaxID=67358 RepID=UPI0016731B86|nr:ABC transporter permease [Streptomyces roseolus]GGR12425.1 ABC transporter permease [Streptomyces roseolus]